MNQPYGVVLLDRTKLLKIFYYLNERLAENQLQLEITVYGGALMTMVYDSRPATRDIDCVFHTANEQLLKNILELTRFTFHLAHDWIDSGIKEPFEALIKEELEIFRSYSNLRILKPIPEQLLAMKVLAARAEPSKDFVVMHISYVESLE